MVCADDGSAPSETRSSLQANALIEREAFIREDKERPIATDGIFEAYHMSKKH